MTPTEAINRLYNWGFHHSNDPRASFQLAFAAKQVVTVIEQRQSDEEAIESIRAMVKEWAKSKRPAYGEPIKIVGNILAQVDQRHPVAAQ